ncbi:hypothetical protein ABIE78_002498 [Sinorhizobium fredii]|uniref:Uncharacterized protein n=1 Tax=Sinorhizobium fredii (strain USDA 257) TaxID=1185652 RepID=I3X6Z5_SINF2|nr:hypothetical protein [Sinorhizobium fredii]AFL51651.1 hypothetical protein USDA257_c30830 [Sinorhizobium fredii USDA 257]
MTKASTGGFHRRSLLKTTATAALTRAHVRHEVMEIRALLDRTYLNCREAVHKPLYERHLFVEAAE